jgi:CRISPR/Cas system-associated exonuclease Cas4 (RecB family)
MDKPSYLEIYNGDNDIVFEITADGTIRYILDGKMKEVQGDDDLIESVRVMVEQWKKTYQSKYTSINNGQEKE